MNQAQTKQLIELFTTAKAELESKGLSYKQVFGILYNKEYVTKSGNILKDDYSNYESLKVFFKGTTILSVVIGGGEEIKETFAGFMDFQIQTMKKTGRGYILNLTSQKMRKDSSLLLYVKQLTEKPQTNLGQLAYNRGKFIGDPKQMSFEIVKIK